MIVNGVRRDPMRVGWDWLDGSYEGQRGLRFLDNPVRRQPEFDHDLDGRIIKLMRADTLVGELPYGHGVEGDPALAEEMADDCQPLQIELLPVVLRKAFRPRRLKIEMDRHDPNQRILKSTASRGFSKPMNSPLS